MSLVDKELVCSECGADFVFSAAEQETFLSRGYTNEPKRCPACREARRGRSFSSSGPRSNSYGGRQMYPAVCAQCGAACEVPFQPRTDRPVYCSDCYRRIRLDTGTRRY